MKWWLRIVPLLVLTLALGSAVQSGPTAVVAAQLPPSTSVQKDGPFRLLVTARAQANRRRAQGFHADTVQEKGFWWVVFYLQ